MNNLGLIRPYNIPEKKKRLNLEEPLFIFFGKIRNIGRVKYFARVVNP